MAQTVKNLPAKQIQSLGQEDPGSEGQWQPTPLFLPGESPGQRSLVGYSPWGHKKLDTTEQLTLSLPMWKWPNLGFNSPLKGENGVHPQER